MVNIIVLSTGSMANISDLVISADTIWVLIAAALVMFMQAGFAMVEAGFTRAKNTANILMKNIIDFSFGSIFFWMIGFGIMFSTFGSGSARGIQFFSNGPDNGNIPGMAFLIFQTVFAATAATIVSGAMAERTDFRVYIIFSIIITTFIYPISGHWIWGGGWLSSMKTPFHDFAGSTAVHSVGAWMGLAGAAVLGPRLGKYNGRTNAIPGHNLTLGALGVFILWFGWFGFNPGSQLASSGLENAMAISHIFLTTNLSAAAGVVGALLAVYILYKKPLLSLSLNGALAGLVSITAGADVISPGGAVVVGGLSGILLVISVSFFDNVLRIDDPVGAISVHGICGAFGTIMVGLFATDGGLLYGGGIKLLVSQLIGVLSVAGWALTTGFILFKTLDATIGLRVPGRVEEEGLDIYEHGETAYN